MDTRSEKVKTEIPVEIKIAVAQDKEFADLVSEVLQESDVCPLGDGRRVVVNSGYESVQNQRFKFAIESNYRIVVNPRPFFLGQGAFLAGCQEASDLRDPFFEPFGSFGDALLFRQVRFL